MVENGGARVVDQRVKPPFALDFQRLAADLAGLSTDPASRPARLELTGRAATHVVAVPEFELALAPRAAEALDALRHAAARAGIDLWPVSGFRTFDRQLSIWNAKFRG